MKLSLSLALLGLTACTATPAPTTTASGLPDLSKPDVELKGGDKGLDVKASLARAAKLIEQRETPGSLDLAIAVLRAQWPKEPASPALNLALAEAHSRACDVLDIKKSADRAPHEKHRKAALLHIDAALKNPPEEGLVRYWRGAILLHFADGEQSYNRMKEALGELLRAEKKTPLADGGGPARLLGRVYQETPGFPMLGSKAKAIEFYGKALERAPDLIQNHLWLGETYQQAKEIEKAKQHLNKAAILPFRKGHEIEEGRYRAAAQALLKKL